MAYFSDKCLRALRSALAEACAEARNSAPPHKMWDDVLRVVYPELQTQARLLTADISPVAQLPIELLVKVFAYFPLWDRVRAATVCHHWRDASLEAKACLWSTVSAPRNPSVCRALLDRAGATAITLFLPKADLDRVDFYAELLSEHWYHIKALDLIIPALSSRDSYYCGHHLGNALLPALRDRAPILESIRVVDRAGMLRRDMDDLPILMSPVLRTIEFHGVDPSCLSSCADSSTVRSLVLATPEHNYGFRLEHWVLICSLSSLEKLAVKVTGPPFKPLEVTGTRLPETLKHLSLELRPETFGQLELENSEHLNKLDSLRISFVGRPATKHLEDLVPLLRDRFSPVSAAIQFKSYRFDLLLVDAAGRRRIVQEALTERGWWHSWVDARKATIGGLVQLPRAQMETVVSLPSLEELTIDLTPTTGGQGSYWFKWPTLRCRSLRTVRIISAGAMVDLGLDVLSEFLRRNLHTASGKLATLVLDNVHVSATPAVRAIESLGEVAGVVSVLVSGAVLPEYHMSWNKSWNELPA